MQLTDNKTKNVKYRVAMIFFEESIYFHDICRKFQ